MLSRAIARTLVRDVKSLASKGTAFRVHDARPLIALVPFLNHAAAPCALTPFSGPALGRAYATAQPAPRKPTARRTTAAKPKGKKTTPKKKKPAAKKSKAKKPKKKTATRGRTKKPQTELQKAREKVRKLRALALLKTPKMLPPTGYTVFTSENSTKGISAPAQARENSNRYRNLRASEREVWPPQSCRCLHVI